MSIYTTLLDALGHAYDSREFEAFLGLLDSPSKLRKIGGYQSKVASKRSGSYLSFSWSRPLWIFDSAILYATVSDGFRPFPEPIEGRVPLASTRADVRAQLGHPTKSGGGGPPIAQVIVDYEWDRYDFPAYSVRFDYDTSTGSIRHASVMTRAVMLELNRERG